MDKIRECGWCGTKKNKPFNMSESIWGMKEVVYCNRYCQIMSAKINARGYLSQWMFMYGVLNSDFLELLNEYVRCSPNGLTRLLKGELSYKQGMSAIDFIDRVGCAISDYVGTMDYGDHEFDVRMLLKGDGIEMWDYGDHGYKSIWSGRDYVNWRSWVYEEMKELKWMISEGMDLVDDKNRDILKFRDELGKIGSGEIDVGYKNWEKGLMLIKRGEMNRLLAIATSRALFHYGIKVDYRKLIKRRSPQYFFKLKKQIKNGKR